MNQNSYPNVLRPIFKCLSLLFRCLSLSAGCLSLGFTLPQATIAGGESAFVPLFNGKDLDGWVPVNIAPDTFVVRDGMLVTSGKPIGLLRTERMYENFILELEWRHMESGGNSGLFIWADGLPSIGSPFVRGVEVQILDDGYNRPGKNEWYTTHGDVFPVNGAQLTLAGRISANGARSFPMEERTRPSPEWNHYRVVAKDGEVRLSVNGKEVTIAREASPRMGYIMLESEGSEIHFRNLRIKELPTSHPEPREIAEIADGMRPLFNGLDFTGWNVPKGDNGHWKVINGVIDYDALSEADGDRHLWTEESFGDFELVVDWKIKEAPWVNSRMYNVLPSGLEEMDADGNPVPYPGPDSDSGIYLRGDGKYQANIWCWPVGSGELYGVRKDKSMPAQVRSGATPIRKADRAVGEWNRFRITVRGETVRILLNGQVVIPGVSVPGLPERGPLVLQHHGTMEDGEWVSPPSLVQFRNIFLREL